MDKLGGSSKASKTQEESKEKKMAVVLPLHARDLTFIEYNNPNHPHYSRHVSTREEEIRLSLLIIILAVSAPAIFIILMQSGIPFALSMPAPLLLLIVSAHLQGKRVLISKKLYPKVKVLEIGALVQRQSTGEEFVIYKVGIKHYYLRSLQTGSRELVSFRRLAEGFLVKEL
ncbi:MAG: hypothetical protein AB7O96_06395 [Pseudobdellovibrionaceae bacterium]